VRWCHGRLCFVLGAESAAQVAGGKVIVPATGHACVWSHGLVLGNGVQLVGTSEGNFEGTTGTIANWTQYGSWIQSTDTVNPTVTALGHGSSVRNLNFIRTQPIPSNTPGTAYTPTVYPFEVVLAGDFVSADNLHMIAAYNGLSIAYNSVSSGGGSTHADHLQIDAMNIAFQTLNVNDTLHVGDVHARTWFYSSNSNIIDWRKANGIGWDMQYTDNIALDGFECLYLAKCIKTTNGTVLGNTHSGYNIQIDKILCGLVVKCIEASGSVLTGQIGSLNVQSDSGATATLLDLSSDGVDLSIANVSVPFGGGVFANLGGGTSGRLKIGNLAMGADASGSVTYGYAAVSTGQTAFIVNAGAHLAIANKNVIRHPSAGSFIGGAGADNVDMPTFCWTPLSSFAQLTVPGTGAQATFTTDNFQNSARFGNFTQVRLQATPNITVATAGTGYVYANAFQTRTSGTGGTAIQCTFSTTSTGFATPCDTNWSDVTDTGQVVGRLGQNVLVGATAVYGNLTFCGR
jgi:hypothetical protein